MKLRWTLVLAAAWALAPATLAQQDTESRGGARRLQGVPGGGEGRKAMYDRIRSELDLDDEQKAKYDAIVDEHKKKGRPGMRGARARGITRGGRGARGGGGSSSGAEPRTDVRGARGDHMDAFFDEVEGILRDDQQKKLADIRKDHAARRGLGGGGPIAQLRRLQGDLKLDDEQNQRYEGLLDKLDEDLKSSRTGGADIGEVIEEIRAAAEAGNTDRVKELRERLPNPRQANDRAVAQFLDEVESFLEPKQLDTLERYKRQLRANREETNLRECFRFVSRLDLDRDQRQEMRGIQRDSARALREARRDAGETARVTAEVKEQLRGMLADEQCAEFDKWLEQKESKRGKQARRGERSRRQPARDAEPEDGETP